MWSGPNPIFLHTQIVLTATYRQHITAYHYCWCLRCKKNFKHRKIEKFAEFKKEHTCEERYWQAGEEHKSHKCMTEKQASDWEKNKWKGGQKYKGVSNAVRNWRNIYTMFFPDAKTIPSHRKSNVLSTVVNTRAHHLLDPTIRHKDKPDATAPAAENSAGNETETGNGINAIEYTDPYDLSPEERLERDIRLQNAPANEGVAGPGMEGVSLTEGTTLVEEDSPSTPSTVDSDELYRIVTGIHDAFKFVGLPRYGCM
jgi:hypothetical protein